MKYKVVAGFLAAMTALGATVAFAVPVGAAGNAGSTDVSAFDPTGAVFTCPDANFTVLGGTVTSVFHDSLAHNGSEHVTGTTVPTGVTLTDGTTDTVYRLAGASWFGGNFNPATGQFVSTDTEFFNILGPTGGVVARVAAVEHMSSGGTNFSFTFGPCQPPQD